MAPSAFASRELPKSPHCRSWSSGIPAFTIELERPAAKIGLGPGILILNRS